MLLFGDLFRLFCGNDFIVRGLVARPGRSGTVVARAAGRAIGRANAKNASSEIRHSSTYGPSTNAVYAEENKTESLPRAKTRAACALNLKVALPPTSQHSTAQTQASKRLPAARAGSGSSLHAFTCLLLLIPRAEPQPHSNPLSCLSAEQYPESTHPGETALRWVRCWRAEAPSYIRCAAHKSPDERQ